MGSFGMVGQRLLMSISCFGNYIPPHLLRTFAHQEFVQLHLGYSCLDTIKHDRSSVLSKNRESEADVLILAFSQVPVYQSEISPAEHRGQLACIEFTGNIIMAAALSSVGYFLYLDKSYTPVAVVVSVITFNAAFGFSWGPIPWLYPPEILPLAFRVKGVSISTSTNWLFNYIVRSPPSVTMLIVGSSRFTFFQVGEATPILQEAIRWKLYPMHAGFCLCSFVVVYFAYPETMGIPLEEMDLLFGDSSHHDLETASLIRASARSGATDPPSLHKRASQSRPKPPSPSLGATVKGWFGARPPISKNPSSSTNYQSVETSGLTEDE
ncbi:hypothetical protein P7C70_g4158, partial [Phenoliferia sp. Uapishka_3]